MRKLVSWLKKILGIGPKEPCNVWFSSGRARKPKPCDIVISLDPDGNVRGGKEPFINTSSDDTGWTIKPIGR